MPLKLRILLTVLAIALLTNASYALKSHQEEQEDNAAESTKKAVEAFNDAVKRIDKAAKIGLKDDTTYSYNYRITSDQRTRLEYERAVKDLQKAIELKTDFKEAHNNLGFCYRKLGKLNESLAAYDKAIALDPNFLQAREYRGETYLALNRLEDAQKELKFLQDAKSDFAVQLAMSIELYKLDEKAKSSSSR